MKKVGEFTNEYGEIFNVLKDGEWFYISGSETGGEKLFILPKEQWRRYPRLKMTEVHVREWWVNDDELKQLEKVMEDNQ